MKKEESEFRKVFQEIIRKNGENIPRTIAEEAELIGISAGQLSRIKNKKSALTNKVINSIVDKFGDDEISAANIRERLENARMQDNSRQIQTEFSNNASSFTETALTEDSLQKFHRKFFQTDKGITRVICFSYREMLQSVNKGKSPEYIAEGAEEQKNTTQFSCALFQFFGPMKEIEKRKSEASRKGDKDSRKAWEYIYEIAEGIHEVFERIKEELGNVDRKVVLYESLIVPPLAECNLHSRLMYSEELVGTSSKNIRIAQLLTGKDKEHFVECITDSGFQLAVAAQFYPILDNWRINAGKLPITETEIEKFLGKNELSPFKVYT